MGLTWALAGKSKDYVINPILSMRCMGASIDDAPLEVIAPVVYVGSSPSPKNAPPLAIAKGRALLGRSKLIRWFNGDFYRLTSRIARDGYRDSHCGFPPFSNVPAWSRRWAFVFDAKLISNSKRPPRAPGSHKGFCTFQQIAVQFLCSLIFRLFYMMQRRWFRGTSHAAALRNQ